MEVCTQEFEALSWKVTNGHSIYWTHVRYRLRFAHQTRSKLRNDSGYLEQVIRPNECIFSLFGKLNRRNCRLSDSEGSNEVYETLRNPSSITTWFILPKNGIIASHFFDIGSVTGSTYKRMCGYFFISQALRVPQKYNTTAVRCSSSLFC